jgi:hypothetical protein
MCDAARIFALSRAPLEVRLFQIVLGLLIDKLALFELPIACSDF